MVIKRVWFLFLCVLCVRPLAGLPNGRVPSWIHSGFCTGEHGLMPLPWDCAGYLNCSRDYSHWANCEPGLKFDAVAKKCLQSSTTCHNLEYVAAKYCPQYLFLKFAHPKTCALYYDCSKTMAMIEYRLKIYEEECKWPDIFDSVNIECSNWQRQNPLRCNKIPTQWDYFREQGPNLSPSKDCVGLRDGSHPDPLQMFLPDYMVCTGEKVTARPRCDMSKNEIFHPVQKTCVGYSETIIEKFCQNNPGITFADPHLCSMYFDCSVKQHNDVLDNYQTECPYLYLYDLKSKSCKRYDETRCGYREEPKAPCDYRVDCPGQGDCASCDATCVGLPDGDNPYRKYPDTRFHLTCEGERTISIKQCTPPEIFLPGKRMCGMEGPYDDGTSAASSATSATSSATSATTSAISVSTSAASDTTTAASDTTTAASDTITTASDTTTAASNTITAASDTTTAASDTTTSTSDTTTSTSDKTTGASDTITAASDTTTATSDTTTTTEPDTSNRGDCNTCGSQLDGFKTDVDLLFNRTEYVSEKANEIHPFQCATPAMEDNSLLTEFYTSSSKTAEYECDEGFTMCGGQPQSVCMTQNQWSDPGGHCVQHSWTKFASIPDETSQITMTYNCPVDELVLTIRGRYIGDVFIFTLRNTDNATDIEMLQFTNPEGNMIAFGDPDSIKAQVTQLYLPNEHEWTLRLNKDNSYVSLNGEYIGQSKHRLDLQQNMTLNIIGGFRPVRVTFQNGPLSLARNIEELSINLAYKQPVETSSSYGSSRPTAVTDGQNLVQWDSHSCWAATAADANPSLTIDLGQDFYISHLVLTTADCTIETCGTLHDIEIIVWRFRRNAPPEELLCAKQVDTLPGSHVQKIPCNKEINGRFVIIQRRNRLNDQDKMAVCEVEVYGGRMMADAWTPHDCPNPPLIPNAVLQLDYTSTEAIATYTCNRTYDTCYGNNVIHCDGPRGWDTVPQPCIQTRFEETLNRGVPSFAVCPFTLGSGIELWITPEGNDMYLTLYDDVASKAVLGINIQLYDDECVIQLQNLDTFRTSAFVKNKEAHVTMSSLTDHILIEVDDKPFYEYAVDSNKALTINMLKVGAGLRIRKARWYRHIGKVVRAAVVENGSPKNLAFQGTSSSSSNYLTEPDVAFDNDQGTNYDNGGCWHSAIFDEDPWIQVDLKKQYYIKTVDLSLQNACPGCGSINLAKSKAAYGSAGIDSKSFPDNLVDGIRNADYDQGSCFASAGPDAWWMVDLGGSFLIKEMSLLGQATAMDKFSDIQIHVFNENPVTVDTAAPVLCTKYSGKMTENQKLVCDSLVHGQFVKITKVDGADPYLAMCEVEVYARLYDRLHDFEIKVFEGKPSPHEVGTVCYKLTGDFTANRGTLGCQEGTYGRYIRLEGKHLDSAADLMTVCEMAIYGVKLVKKAWSPYDCPNPPLMPIAEVVVSRSSQRATATYTCKRGYSQLCGSDVIHCEGIVGWTGRPSACQQTTFSSKEDTGLSPVSLPCKLRLGQAIEIAYTPTSERSSLMLQDRIQGKSVLDLTIDMAQPSIRIISDLGFRVTPNADIKLNKEFLMIFTFLTKTIDISIDGVYLTHIYTQGLVDAVVAPQSRLRSVRILPASEAVGADRSFYPHITYPGLTVTASSKESSEPRRVIDGDLTRDSTVGSCWSSAVGDLTPHILLDLDHYYYIERVVLITKSDCTGECAERTHDILINVFYENPTTTSETPQRCFYREGAIPPDTEETIVCTTTVRGRYVKLEGLNRRDGNDQLTFCEVTVFGGEVIRKPTAIVTKQPVIARTVGYRCIDDVECNFQHGQCLDGACGCATPGYKYDSYNDQCRQP